MTPEYTYSFISKRFKKLTLGNHQGTLSPKNLETWSYKKVYILLEFRYVLIFSNLTVKRICERSSAQVLLGHKSFSRCVRCFSFIRIVAPGRISSLPSSPSQPQRLILKIILKISIANLQFFLLQTYSIWKYQTSNFPLRSTIFSQTFLIIAQLCEEIFIRDFNRQCAKMPKNDTTFLIFTWFWYGFIIFLVCKRQYHRPKFYSFMFLIYLFVFGIERVEFLAMVLDGSMAYHFLINGPFCNSPADTDIFKTSSGRLKKVTTSYDQTRRCQDVWKKTFDLGRHKDVWF